MDVVLGVSMGSTAVRMVLVEGENADGATVDEDNFRVTTPNAAGQVLSAILGTREGANEGGYHLTSTGVAWTDPAEAAVLRDTLAAYKVENVMLVSAFLATAALTQTVGNALGYHHTAMLLVEPETATLAIVNSGDGSITAVRRQPLHADTVAQLAAMIMSCDAPQARPQGVFLVGRGIDIGPLKPALEAVIPLRVSAPEEPDMALARGAALASANAPLFVSSTAALAYAQDPGTGNVDLYLNVADVAAEPVAYSGVSDPDDDVDTIVMRPAADAGARQRRRPVLLLGSVLGVIFVSAAIALGVALAINVRSTVALLPNPNQNLIAPTEQAPAPAPTLQASPPAHQLVPPPTANVPDAPSVVVQAPAAPAPAAPAPVAEPAPAPEAIAPVPVPVPAAPGPVPAPVAPVPVPIPIPVPVAPPVVPNLQLPLNLPGSQPVVRAPTPPLQLPSPQLQLPTPPVQLPTPKPPVDLPTPKPPVQVPTPKQPVQVPTPKPPVQLPTPKPPVQVPAPKPPVQLPAPKAPTAPAPAAPRMPVPAAPQVPAAPSGPRNPATAPHFGR